MFPHHENEIAQSEGATGKQFVKYWMHNEWVLVDQKKMAKSAKNFYTLRDVIDRGINPIAYRFWLLMANYRTRINFVWEALEGAETALKRLYGLYLALPSEIGQVHQEYQNKFKEFIEDDLDTPRALALLWDVFKDPNMSDTDKKATILDFDKVLGLGFKNLKKEIIPEDVKKLAEEREQTRNDKDFKKSDELRKKINSLGYDIKDTAEGQKINKI
jgi:cysteinyl-tRNA synthetase